MNCPHCEDNGKTIELENEQVISDSADHNGNHEQYTSTVLTCPECPYIFN